MLFSSFEFYLFFFAVFLCHRLAPGRYRWLVLLLASYLFYYRWTPWFPLVLIFCTLSTWVVVLRMVRTTGERGRKTLLVLGLAVNLIPLIILKYSAFLLGGIGDALFLRHELLLPVGISFYSFTAMSYCIDTYRGVIEAEKHPGIFALSLAFFPKLISGPIERGKNLLPQLRSETAIDSSRVVSGIQLVVWGIFKKMVLADRLAMYVDMVFSHPQDYWGWTILIAVWLFALQIYCDFSAYMDMAIGCGRVFGIELSANFNFPYMAGSVMEFWQRWHITLTSWFRDYLYVPLGGNRVPASRWVVNILLVFLLSGLWHGAAWTFVCWGGLHGLLYLAGKWTWTGRERLKDFLNIRGKPAKVMQVVITFNLVALAWIFFRAQSLSDAFCLISHMVVNLHLPVRMMSSQFSTAVSFCCGLFFLLSELVLFWEQKHGEPMAAVLPVSCKIIVAVLGLLTISLFGVSSHEFIYFHF